MGNFSNVINSYANCIILDISRVTGVTEIPSYAFDYTNLESVYLPATIEKIGSRAFYQCKQLSSLTVYAMVPPTLESNVFTGIQEGLVVYVPAAAIAQYQDASGWKDFTILPIQEDIRSLSVSLPEGAKTSDYSQMWLELTNTKSGQKMHYVMTDRTTYTFANIIRNTSWNAVLRNQRGDVFGKIEDIDVKDEDVSVTFSALSTPKNVSLSVKTPDGNDVTSRIQVTWIDANGNYIAQSAGLSGLISGYALSYKVALPQDLAMQYNTPEQTDYVVSDAGNALTLTLVPINQVTISGCVKDVATKTALNGATVTASQTFGGKYSKTVSTKTDAKGNYSLNISNVPTTLAVSASDYISQSIVCDSLMTGNENISMSDISLKAISGAVISLNLTYTKCPTENGDEDTFQEWYADYNNVSYSIYNKTKHKSVNQFNVQYPQIVLLEDVDEGDVLEMTATSKTNDFLPVNATATINEEQRANAAFDIVELGKIKASFAKNSNAAVVGSLYDANGKLVKSYDYNNASLTINDLTDGSYTLVTMGSSKLFNSIYDLSQLPQTGLTLGADYAQSSVEVQSGNVSVINIAEVPTLNESKLYYTGDNTSFTVNKSSIVAGNYLTLTGHLDFKSAYATKVSNVNLIVDIPESCEFVENSVMVGSSTSSYTIQNNRITIPMARYTDRVRFCIIPTLGGDYAPSALAQFDIEGETITQPIGSANYTAKDLSINVPSTVAKTTIPVSGTAIGACDIEIYDGDVMIGQTRSLANGTWAATCELDEAYNLSRHNIYAKIITKTGLVLISESASCNYDVNAIQVSKVIMYHDNPEMHKTYKVIYDFLNPKSDSQYYIYYIYNKKFTFTVEFTDNDTTKISDVVINVRTGNGTDTSLSASFDPKLGLWVASGKFGNMYDGNIPINVSIDYSCMDNPLVDRKLLDSEYSVLEEFCNANNREREEFDAMTSLSSHDNVINDIINQIIDADELNYPYLSELIDSLERNPLSFESENVDDYDEQVYELTQEYDNWCKDYKAEKDSIINELFFDSSVDLFDYAQLEQPNNRTIVYEALSISDSECESIMKDYSYNSYQLTDGSNIFYIFSDNHQEFVDVLKRVKYKIYKEEQELVDSKVLKMLSSEGTNKRAESIFTTFQKIKDQYNNGSLSINEACDKLKTLANFVQGYYAAILLNADYKLTKSYNAAIKNYDLKITKRENLKNISWERINTFRDKIASNVTAKNDIDDLLKNGQELLTKGDLSPEEFSQLSSKCSEWKEMSNYHDAQISAYKSALKKENNTYAALVNQIDDLKKGRTGIVTAKSKINSLLSKLPQRILPKGKVGKLIGIGGKLAGFFGGVISVWSFGCDVLDAANELDEWAQLQDAIDRKMPCENDQERAIILQNNIHRDASKILAHYISILSSELGGIAYNLADGVPGISPTWWIGSVCNIYAEWAKVIAIKNYIDLRGDYWLDISYLQCTGKEPKDPRQNKNDKNGKKRNHEDSGIENTKPGIDPSGYVYEGISSNRLEGVTATCFYKEMVEDMYGDLHENIVKWDAEEYAQENPLFTDENGYYRWDVPQGMWQVKFEKDGYETTYSDWLPVPPPQLDVNIAMKQNVQPNVKNARAYEDAVEVEFDKYMMPELLNTDNIIVMAGGKQVEGTVELLNEEVKYEGETETFASKLRFNASAPFEGTEITLMVNNRVKSYAGIRMQDNYSQSFTIEQEIRKIVCDSATVVRYGDNGFIPVTVLPASASAGKTINVRNSSAMILGTDATSVVLDEEGKAIISVSGELPGTAALTFTVDGYEITATTIINVEMKQDIEISAPVANIASGTTVEKGTAITLTCATKDATIYYTTDGSCPCDEGSRIKYTEPIIIDKTMTIKAMAIDSDGNESDVVELSYVVDETNGIEDIDIDGNLKIYPLPVRGKLNVNAGGKIIKSVTLTNMNGSSVVESLKPVTIVTIDVSSLTPGIYIINVATEDKTYSHKIIKIE